MNGSIRNNGLRTGLTRATAPKSSLPEERFLQQQADEARRAITNTAHRLGVNLGRGANPRAWARHHPLAVLGSAAVVGVAAVRFVRHRIKEPEGCASDTSDNTGHHNGDSDAVEAVSSSAPRRKSLLARAVMVSRVVVDSLRILRPILTDILTPAQPDPPRVASRAPLADSEDADASSI